MPPLPLVNRVGVRAEAEDLYAFYEQLGANVREQILRMLPPGYELEGRRLLDFGCGAGRTLRHFLGEADSAEIWGCDIDEESIAWLERNLCPPLNVLRNEAAPGLPFEDGHFELIWAVSVFTHLGNDAWAAWMLELHRLLADDGILIATTIGPNHSERIAKERWEEDRIGMNALRHWASWDDGGPWSFTRPGGCGLTGAGPSRSSRSTSRPGGSLARDAKARRRPHGRGPRAPGARRAARAHRRAPPRPAAAGRARERSRPSCRAGPAGAAAPRPGPAAPRAGAAAAAARCEAARPAEAAEGDARIARVCRCGAALASPPQREAGVLAARDPSGARRRRLIGLRSPRSRRAAGITLGIGSAVTQMPVGARE